MKDSLSQLVPESPLEVVPLVGVPPLRFGMSLDEIKSLLGEPGGVHDGVYFFGSQLRVEHSDGTVVFFQISWWPETPSVTCRGVSVFDTPAEELVEYISGERRDRDYDEFEDFELDLALWRPTLPSDYEPTEPDDGYRRGRYWMVIAIGHGGYFRESARRVAAIRDRRS